MAKWTRTDLSIPSVQIQSRAVSYLSITHPMALDLARPLFDMDVWQLALAQHAEYETDRSPTRAFHEVMIMLQGEMEVHVRGRRNVVEPGMIFMCPNTVFFSRRGITESIRWIYIQLQPTHLWRPFERSGPHVRKYEYMDYLYVLVNRLLAAFETESLGQRADALMYSRGLVDLLKHELHRMEEQPSRHADTLEQLVRNIQAKPDTDWTITKMAEETGLTVRTLTRHCQQVYGTSPMDLVIRERLRIAISHIEGGKGLEETARLVGYSSANAFSNLFYRHIGVRPGRFKTQVAREYEEFIERRRKQELETRAEG